MRGEYYCLALSQFPYQGTYFDNLIGIEAGGGLVKYKNIRVVDDCLGKADPLFIAFGKAFNPLFSDLFQTAGRDGSVQDILHFFPGDKPGSGHKG